MIEDQAAADAGTEEEVREVRHSPARAGPALTDRGGRGVVVHRHRQPGGITDHPSQGHTRPVRELGWINDHAEVLVNRPGGGETQTEDLAGRDIRLGERVGNQLGHGRHDLGRVRAMGRGLFRDHQRPAEQVDHDTCQFDRVEVQADRPARVGVEAQGGTGLATAGDPAGPVLQHDAVVEQAAHDAGDRLRSQAGLLGNLHPADAVGQLDLVQYNRLVVPPDLREIRSGLPHA